jgi:uncharacterized protein (UPF0333 family)
MKGGVCVRNAMRRARVFLGRRLADRRGQTALEYFLLAGAVAILVGVAAFTFGGKVGAAVVTGQNCAANITTTATAGTATSFSGTGAGPCS